MIIKNYTQWRKALEETCKVNPNMSVEFTGTRDKGCRAHYYWKINNTIVRDADAGYWNGREGTKLL